MHSISTLLPLVVVLMNCLNDVKAATCATGNICQNGATCVDTLVNTLVCICPPQWTGDLCDYPAATVNACSANPCLNGGACSALANGGFSCTCPPNYTGFLCDQLTATTPTIQNTYCLNGGVCVYVAPYYQCVCPLGYAGSRCEVFVG